MREAPPDHRPRRSADRGEDVAPEEVSGRVAFDSRGNAVWEFRTDDGLYALDADTELVRKLDEPMLSLERTAILRKAAEPAAARRVGGESGFNPYDNAASDDPPTRAPARPALKFPPVHPAIVPQRPEGRLLQRLWPWRRPHRR